MESHTLTIRFELPEDIVRQLGTAGIDPHQEAREAYLVELYRSERITHAQLAEALGLGRYETDGLLKRHGVGLEIGVDELRAASGLLRDASPG